MTMPESDFTLHIWGGALGLPSIDADCLAVVTLLRQTISRDSWSKWQIISSNDPSVSPSKVLPALYHDSTWICGYCPIARYLDTLTTSTSLITPPPTNPEATAFATWLTAKACTLIDLTLYISMQNWTAVTRPAYSELLPWPLTWTIPPVLRRAAVARAERQGFGDLDADAEVRRVKAEKKEAKVPSSFDWRLPGMQRRTVLGHMSPEAAAGIRLYSFAKQVLTIVQEHRGCFVLENRLTAEGCLVYAVLALLVTPDLPQGWLRELIQAEFPELLEFVEGVDAGTVGKQSGRSLDIIRKTREPMAIVTPILHHMVLEMPVLGELYLEEWKASVLSYPVDGGPRRPTRLISGTVLVAAVAAGLYYYIRSLHPLGRPLYIWNPPSATRLGQLGEVGAMLGIAMGGTSMGYSSLNQRQGVVEDMSIDL